MLENDDWSNFGEHAADTSCDPSDEGENDDVLGCTYASACNYNNAANADDGSCDFASCSIPGCTYVNALNFNPLSTIDDGNCLFPACDNTCPTDINSDGVITVADVLLLLTDFGLTCPG